MVLKKSVKIKLLDISKHKKHSWENLEKRSGPSCETLLKEIPALIIE